MTIPNSAADSSTFVCVTTLHTARVGGNLAFADFQFTPPFGSSILGLRSLRPAALQPALMCDGTSLYQPYGETFGDRLSRVAGGQLRIRGLAVLRLLLVDACPSIWQCGVMLNYPVCDRVKRAE